MINRSGYDADPVECRGAINASASHHVCTAVAPTTVPPASAADFGCVLSIRGSKTFTNALNDAFFWSDELPHEERHRAMARTEQMKPGLLVHVPIQDCQGCQVFDGFWRVWTGIESKVERVLIDNGCIPGTPQGTILLTGHSLGAAVATLAMYMLQLRGYSVGLSYNFASPRIGNDAFHDAFAKVFNRSVSVYRITRARDPVVHVPPLPIYHHVGSEAYFHGNTPKLELQPSHEPTMTWGTLWWCVWAQKTRNAQIAIHCSRRSFLVMTIASQSWPRRGSRALACANASFRTESEKCLRSVAILDGQDIIHLLRP
eukprot:s3786_g3.t1